MSTPPLNLLVTKIRGAHPGAYDDMNDAALTKAVLAKYPQYSDLAAPPVSKPPINVQPVDITGQPQNPTAGMAGVPGGSSNPVPATPGYMAAVGVPLGAAGAVMGATTAAGVASAAVLPHVLRLGEWARKNPAAAYAAIEALKMAVPGFKKATDLVRKSPTQ